eukprot:gene30502-35522_t
MPPPLKTAPASENFGSYSIQWAAGIIIHTGDAWGRGCTDELEFAIVGTRGRIVSSQCVQQDVSNVTALRDKAVQYAVEHDDGPVLLGTGPKLPPAPIEPEDAATEGKGISVGATGAGTGPSMEKRTIFGLFRGVKASPWAQPELGLAPLWRSVPSSGFSGCA